MCADYFGRAPRLLWQGGHREVLQQPLLLVGSVGEYQREGGMCGYLPCPALSLSYTRLPELGVLVDSNEEFRAELARFRGPFLVGRDRNSTKSSLELHKYSCEKGIRSTNILRS